MDDFGFDRAELTGSLISMEFGQGGRIQQLWVADSGIRDDGEEFQFILPPVNLGEEISDDYNPGTILLGARTNPDDPWILSRNTSAEVVEDGEDPMVTVFDYEFGLLPEITARGRFYELPGDVPQIVWDLKLKNAGRVTVEIGELAFPLAFNNFYEGFPQTDRGLEELYKDRLLLHPFIGGAASYLFAQRLNAEAPGLLITPGENTSWEFMSHVSASLQTPFRWDGIPVIYVHSRAVIERESWGEWFNEHTARVLEPGDMLQAQLRFSAAWRDRFDGLHHTLVTAHRPAFRIFPAAVAPADVGVSVEVGGTVPARFFGDRDAETDTDSDQEGGYCFIKPDGPGPFTLFVEDTIGQVSNCHLLFTEPIEDLIVKRAEWIVAKQQLDDPLSNLHSAYLPTNIDTGENLTDPEEYASPFGVESILSDALFLAEKNLLYPDLAEIHSLEKFVDEFLRKSLQNPSNGAVGSSFIDATSTAVHFGRPQVYPMASVFYHILSKISRDTGTHAHDANFYLSQAALTAKALVEQSDPASWRLIGLPLMASMEEAIDEARRENLLPESFPVLRRPEDLSMRRYPFGGFTSLWDTTGFEEVSHAAAKSGNFNLQERALSCAFSARSLAPSWWWYGSDKRFWDDSDGLHHPFYGDKGESCLGPSTAGNAALVARHLMRDAVAFPEPLVRAAFGGLLGVWALVRSDGAAAHGFCPDPASKQFGMSWVTGTAGLGLYYYLKNAASYVLPNRSQGIVAFGCSFEAQEETEEVAVSVQPWDGVGRKVVVRQLGVDVEVKRCQVKELRFGSRKRTATLFLRNPSDSARNAEVILRGLWGTLFEVNGKKEQIANGALSFELPLPPNSVVEIGVRVIG